jgi:flagellar hook protein FlgE
MLRSLFSGVSGLRAHQTMMDVVGNNIANVNTVGFKASQTVFQDTLSQMLQGAGAPTGANGGTNPAQVGLGVRLAGISTNYTQGATQSTGRGTDLMIQGDGFFVISQGGEQLYTRAGAFDFDALGRLVTPTGGIVQGWSAVNGVVNTNAAVGDIRLQISEVLAPAVTKNVTVGGNLPADAAAGTSIVTSITAYDAQGKAVDLTLKYDFDGTNWTLNMSDDATPPNTATQTLAFDPATFKATGGPIAATLGGLTFDLDISGLSNYGGSNTVAALNQDGYGMGSLASFSIGPDGTLMGVFTNGLKQPLGRIALASFDNPPGLEKAGGSLYRASVNSGNPSIGTATSGGRGMISGGSLEMSNVDLAQEFTNLIIAQRGFQANSRVITSSDEILQDLVNLKR